MIRAIRFNVEFVGHRKADLLGKGGLFYGLAQARAELTRAANLVLGTLHYTKAGVLPHPRGPSGQPMHLRTLAYQGFSGAWRPTGTELYAPQGRRLSSKVLLGAADLVYTRLKTDYADTQAGRRAVATLREIPFTVQGQAVTLFPNGRLSIPLWDGRRHNRLVLAPSRFRGGQDKIWRQIIKGELQLGDVRLFRPPHGQKWTVAVTWKGEVTPRTGQLIAGVHLGIVNTASIAYCDAQTGKLQPFVDRVQLPANVVRAWTRLDAERRARLEGGAVTTGARHGRGRQRKLRAADQLGQRKVDLVQTAVRNVAAAVLHRVIVRGAIAIAVEDLTGFVDDVMAASSELPEALRRERRRGFLQWEQGRVRQCLHDDAEREGLLPLSVDPAGDSQTCSDCGTVYPRGPHNPPTKEGEEKGAWGRVSWGEFRCRCGLRMHADRNAPRNVALRGWRTWAALQANAVVKEMQP